MAGISIFCSLVWGQQMAVRWQDEVQRYTNAQDWTAAMSIVDREIARAPRDLDVRAWRARILMWSGQLVEAEREYLEILAVASCLLPSLHRMILFARANTSGGIVKPSVFAVFRLITNSNFVGCSTGKSAGLAPLRILST